MKTKEEIFEEYNEYQTENDYVNSEEELKDYINIAIDNIKYQKEDLFKEVKANKRMKRLSALKNFFLGAFQLYGTDLYNKDNEIIKEILIFINYFQEMYLRISQTVTADNYQEMLKLNCDLIATGHYAKIEAGHILKSKDEFKDQTYFLCEVSKEILNHLILPLEGIEKSKVRELAASYNLEVASKKDSTDVCFITKTFREFISNKIPSTPGDIIDISTKKVLGKHRGLSNYTIGQRKGLNIGGAADRVFVAGKDLENNILYVTIGDEEKLISDSCIIENVNWLATEKVTSCLAKFRYHAKDVKVSLEWLDNEEILVKYPEGFRAVTPGQACVFYLGDECLGGGIIKTVKKNEEELWYI